MQRRAVELFTKRMPRSEEKERTHQSIIAPIAFMIGWSVALSKYPQFDTMKLYAIIDLTVCCFLIVASWKLPPWILYIRVVFAVTMFALGWVWFTNFTGYSIFRMVSELGPGYWLTYPLLIQVVYFQLWYYIAFAGLVVLMFIITFLLSLVKRRQRQSRTEEGVVPPRGESEDTLDGGPDYLSHIAPLPSLRSLKEFQAWALKQKTCSSCKETLEDTPTILQCGHMFHPQCIGVWAGRNPESDITCPLCKMPVLVQS